MNVLRHLQKPGASAELVLCVVEHDMRVVAGSDYVIDIGPGAGEGGGRVIASGTPAEVAAANTQTATYLSRFLRDTVRAA